MRTQFIKGVLKCHTITGSNIHWLSPKNIFLHFPSLCPSTYFTSHICLSFRWIFDTVWQGLWGITLHFLIITKKRRKKENYRKHTVYVYAISGSGFFMCVCVGVCNSVSSTELYNLVEQIGCEPKHQTSKLRQFLSVT